MLSARKLQNLCEQAQQMKVATRQEREEVLKAIQKAFNEVRKSLDKERWWCIRIITMPYYLFHFLDA